MLKIAICDDQKNEIDEILHLLSMYQNENKKDIEVSTFLSAKDLLHTLESKSYDIFILDIIMGEMDGIELANKISRMQVDAYILFVSSFQERWRELFFQNTIGFLDKPATYKPFEELMNKVVNRIHENQNNILTYKKNGKTHMIKQTHIIYIESVQHYIHMHTLDEVIIFRGRIKDVWDELKNGLLFCKPNKSYIVNMQHISLSKSTIEIPLNNIEVSIGRVYKEDTICRFMNYLKNKGTG